MTTSRSTSTVSARRRRLAAAATALGLLLAVGTAVSPASAHDELVSSTPAAGDALDPAPSEITLTFSDNILEVGVEVSVTDAAGTQYLAETPVVEGPTVTAGLEPEVPGGSYQVDWRVVSSDGHPISGTIPFTVTTPAETTTPAPAGSEPPVATAPSDEEAATPATPSGDVSDDATSNTGPSGGQIALIAAIALAALVVIAALLIILGRRRGRADETDAEETDAEDSTRRDDQ